MPLTILHYIANSSFQTLSMLCINCSHFVIKTKHWFYYILLNMFLVTNPYLIQAYSVLDHSFIISPHCMVVIHLLLILTGKHILHHTHHHSSEHALLFISQKHFSSPRIVTIFLESIIIMVISGFISIDHVNTSNI